MYDNPPTPFNGPFAESFVEVGDASVVGGKRLANGVLGTIVADVVLFVDWLIKLPEGLIVDGAVRRLKSAPVPEVVALSNNRQVDAPDVEPLPDKSGALEGVEVSFGKVVER